MNVSDMDPSKSRKSIDATARLREEQEYQEALQTVGLHWKAGGTPPGRKMPSVVREAYQIVGRFAGRHYAPRHGVPHPAKSARYRLKGLDATCLPAGAQIVTKAVKTGTRSWCSTFLEIRDPATETLTRYKTGLSGPRIAIRGMSRGRGSKAQNACDWRALTRNEAKNLHPGVKSFLHFLGGRPRQSTS